jgi:hypothetical protein
MYISKVTLNYNNVYNNPGYMIHIRFISKYIAIDEHKLSIKYYVVIPWLTVVLYDEV